MKKKFTHQGVLVAASSCVPDNYRKTVLVRETKNFYVTQHGMKYYKNGGGVGDWPHHSLVEIKLLTTPVTM